MTERKRQLLSVLAVMALVFVADQATKLAVVKYIEVGTFTHQGEGPAFFTFTHQRNEGLVNGAFRDKPIVAMTAPLLAVCVLIYLYRHLVATSWVQNIAYGMVAGGALGNIVDRFLRGSVVDFLQFHFHFIPFDFPWKFYPAFNIADSGICVGVVLLIFTWRHPEEGQTPDAADPA
jgi:signal peptidase II